MNMPLREGWFVVIWMRDEPSPAVIAQVDFDDEDQIFIETTIREAVDTDAVKKILQHLAEDCDHIKHKRRARQLMEEELEKQLRKKENARDDLPDIPF